MSQDNDAQQQDTSPAPAAPEPAAPSGGRASGGGRTTRDLPARPSHLLPLGDPAAAAAQEAHLQPLRDATRAHEADIFGWGQVQLDDAPPDGGYEAALTFLGQQQSQEAATADTDDHAEAASAVGVDVADQGVIPPPAAPAATLPGLEVLHAANAERAAAPPPPPEPGPAAPPAGPAAAPDEAATPVKQDAPWVAGARAYNAKYKGEFGDAFNAATGNACAVDGELDPEKVKAWQAQHGCTADGKVGPDTLAASKTGGGGAPAPAGPGANAAPIPIPVAAPAPVPVAPAPAPAPIHAAPTANVPAPAPAPAPAPTAPAVTPETPIVRHINSGTQTCLVFVSPGGLTNSTPDIFLMLHGHMADLGVDPSLKGKGGNKSGSDTAGEAMKLARGKNLIAILPQGVFGTSSITVGKGAEKKKIALAREKQGGYMADLQQGLPGFLSAVLGKLAGELQVAGLTPGKISIAGHSAGGYMGMHDALRNAGALMGNITDLTMMDSNYSSAHFADAAKWMFAGGPGKALRIVGSPSHITGERAGTYTSYFTGKNLERLAAKAGCTVTTLKKGDKRDNKTEVIQHSQVLKEGAVQCDILVLQTTRDHHQIRDDVMFDAVHSIGEGAAGSDKFGRAESYAAAHQAPTAPVAPTPQAPGAETQVGPESGAPLTGAGNEADYPDAEPDHGPDMVTPEKVTEPKVDPAPPKAPTGGGGKLHKEAGKEIYATGGRLSADKLSRGGLGDAEFAFKRRVYDAATEAHGKKIYGGVSKENLKGVEGGGQMRSDAAGPLEALVAALRAAVAAGEVVDGMTPDATDNVKIGSTYRSPEVDFNLWDSRFSKYMRLTVADREALGDPLGSAAVKFMVRWIGHRKAPPGRSNHSNGTAVDLKLVEKGKTHGNDYGDQKAWHKSWQLRWLKLHAPKMQFAPYDREAWHWTYQG